jgi:hypothetical protein
MDLDHIMLSEISQSQKVILHDLTYTESKIVKLVKIGSRMVDAKDLGIVQKRKWGVATQWIQFQSHKMTIQYT